MKFKSGFFSWLLSLGVLLTVTASLHADDDRDKAEFVRPLLRAGAPTEALGSFRFDSELYDKMRSPVADLRIFTPDGTVVPFRVIPECEIRQIRYFEPEPTKLTSYDGDSTFELENSKGRPVSRLLLKTSARDFAKQVRIESSSNRTDWKLLTENQPFYDYSGRVDLAKRYVDFPRTSAKYFRVTISDYQSDEPLPVFSVVTDSAGQVVNTTREWRSQTIKIDRFQLENAKFRKGAVTLKPIPYPFKPLSREEHEQKTFLTFASKREPLTRLTLNAEDPFFVRTITVAGSNDNKTYKHIATKTLRKIPPHGGKNESANTLSLPETRYHFYRIGIDNGDNAPLKKPLISVEGASHRAYFFSREPELQLYYAGELPPPRFDIDAMLDTINTARFVSYTPGEPEKNTLFNSFGRLLRTSLPGISLAILLLGVCWALWRALKKVEKQKNQENQEKK